ncbi:VOC family protein [Kitasatospora sp. NPDC056651]|uniref:VOC family protein n=1 Tax=Kitasatospora sp. NPDC056651 TaxID=3345892 RepID=UPI0036BEDF9B
MASLVRHVTIDCADPYALAGFWVQVLDGTRGEDDHPEDPMAVVESAGASLLFIRVPDTKSVKNRLHLDLQPQDRGREEEVERLVALGATVLADHRLPNGKGWATLADPNAPDYQFWSSPRCRPPPLPATSGLRPPLRRV